MIALADRVLVMHNKAIVGVLVNCRDYDEMSKKIFHAIHGDGARPEEAA